MQDELKAMDVWCVDPVKGTVHSRQHLELRGKIEAIKVGMQTEEMHRSKSRTHWHDWHVLVVTVRTLLKMVSRSVGS